MSDRARHHPAHLCAGPKFHPDRLSFNSRADRMGWMITISVYTPGEWGPSDGMRVETVIVRTVRAAIALLMIPLILAYAAIAGVALPGARVVTALLPAGGRPMRVRLAT